MITAIVTVKLPRRADHNPRNKITGKCPVSKGKCTDVTGEHHSVLYTGENETLPEIRQIFERLGFHVTRIEEVVPK